MTSLKVGLPASPAAILIAVRAAYAVIRVSFLERESLPQLSFADDRARRDSRDPALGSLWLLGLIGAATGLALAHIILAL